MIKIIGENMEETIKHHSVYKIYKYHDEDGQIAKMSKAGVNIEHITPYEIVTFERNTLLNVGMNEMWDIIIGDSTDKFNSTNARVGVGIDDTEASASDTDVLANGVYESMDAGYPSVTSNTVYFRATFDGDTANQDWNEYVVKNNASGICLNRKVENKGTKGSGESWILEIRITLS
jgi:hypothetical protein